MIGSAYPYHVGAIEHFTVFKFVLKTIWIEAKAKKAFRWVDFGEPIIIDNMKI